MVLNKLSYRLKLFALVMGLSWILVACFIVFQYSRERQYKAQWLDERLQLFNLRVADAMGAGMTPAEFLVSNPVPFADLRLTVMDTSGKVIYDNRADSLPVSNHLDRPEVRMALANGTGFAKSRHSATTDKVYFYSAMAEGDIIVRSAAPYSLSLEELLAADRDFLWFILIVTILTGTVAFLSTRKLGMTISRLNRFASKAEAGQEILDDEAFPHDELGEISRHIVRLYIRHKEQYERLMRQEEEKSRLKRELTNNINHELKTPVAALQVCVETLRLHPDLPDEKRRSILSRCADNIARLESLLADVSTLTRLEDGRSAIADETVCLNDIISEVAKEYDSESYIPINVCLETPITLRGNSQLMAAAFRNLIDNAMKYSQASRIDIFQAGNRTIVFADNGIGVPPDALARIFERFYRVDKGRSRELGGTGLGLSIVKHTIAMHRGNITASNREDGGLMFTIKFADYGQEVVCDSE